MIITPGGQIFSNNVEGNSEGNEKQSVRKWLAMSWQPVLAELVATAILLLLGCMSCLPLDGSTPEDLYTSLAFGLVVMFNIQIFGPISGAHMNPSVTFASVMWGSMSIPLGIAYVLAQCAGAVIGYGILVAVSPVSLSTGAVCVSLPHATLTPWQAVGIEIALTSALNFINCSLWDAVKMGTADSVPIKFGLAIAGLSMAGGPLTGASMNPARSLGPAVWTGLWTTHWVYWVGPLIGSILPILIYRFTWLNMHTAEEQKQ